MKGHGVRGMLQFEVEVELRLSVDEVDEIGGEQGVVNELLRSSIDHLLSPAEEVVQDDVVVKTADAAKNVHVEIDAWDVVEAAKNQSRA